MFFIGIIFATLLVGNGEASCRTHSGLEDSISLIQLSQQKEVRQRASPKETEEDNEEDDEEDDEEDEGDQEEEADEGASVHADYTKDFASNFKPSEMWNERISDDTEDQDPRTAVFSYAKGKLDSTRLDVRDTFQKVAPQLVSKIQEGIEKRGAEIDKNKAEVKKKMDAIAPAAKAWSQEKIDRWAQKKQWKIDNTIGTLDEYPEQYYKMEVTSNWKDWYENMMDVYPPKDKEGYDMLNYGLVSTPMHECAAKVPAGTSEHSMPFNNTAGANLYAVLASQSPVNLSGAKVLEIAHGRGGGAAVLSDCFCPHMMVGVDISDKQTDYAKSRYGRAGKCPISFIQGDAMNLPFGDETFDVVVNVQASHAVPSYRTFAKEVLRVLRPGGAFLSSDFRYEFGAHTDGRILQDVFQTPVTLLDATPGVVQALDENRKTQPFLDSCGNDFAAEKHLQEPRLKAEKTRFAAEHQRQLWERLTGIHWAPADVGAQGQPSQWIQGVPLPRMCEVHAGTKHLQFLRTRKMVYFMHIITKKGTQDNRRSAQPGKSNSLTVEQQDEEPEQGESPQGDSPQADESISEDERKAKATIEMKESIVPAVTATVGKMRHGYNQKQFWDKFGGAKPNVDI